MWIAAEGQGGDSGQVGPKQRQRVRVWCVLRAGGQGICRL